MDKSDEKTFNELLESKSIKDNCKLGKSYILGIDMGYDIVDKYYNSEDIDIKPKNKLDEFKMGLYEPIFELLDNLDEERNRLITMIKLEEIKKEKYKSYLYYLMLDKNNMIYNFHLLFMINDLCERMKFY